MSLEGSILFNGACYWRSKRIFQHISWEIHLIYLLILFIYFNTFQMTLHLQCFPVFFSFPTANRKSSLVSGYRPGENLLPARKKKTNTFPIANLFVRIYVFSLQTIKGRSLCSFFSPHELNQHSDFFSFSNNTWLWRWKFDSWLANHIPFIPKNHLKTTIGRCLFEFKN